MVTVDHSKEPNSLIKCFRNPISRFKTNLDKARVRFEIVSSPGTSVASEQHLNTYIFPTVDASTLHCASTVSD